MRSILKVVVHTLEVFLLSQFTALASLKILIWDREYVCILCAISRQLAPDPREKAHGDAFNITDVKEMAGEQFSRGQAVDL